MSILAPAFFGLGDDSHKATPMPPRFRAVLIGTIAVLYLSNSFASPLTSFMIQFKWVMMGILGITAISMLAGRPTPKFPMSMAIPTFALAVVCLVCSWGSSDLGLTWLSVITVAATILTGYLMSAFIIATDSRRAFFDLLATFGRVIIVLTTLFALVGLNLGRGAGLSAWSDNPNTLAAIMAPSLVIFLAGCIERKPGWPFWHGAFFIIGFWLMWATNSRASTIWVVVSLATFWLYRRGPGFSVILTIAFFIVLIGWWYPIKVYTIQTLGLEWNARVNGISPLSGREEVWKIGWELFGKKPLTGYGLGTSQELIKAESWKFVRHQGNHFHSSYITILVELGIFGLLSTVAALVMTVGRAVADSARTRILPRESWPSAALPFALITGSLAHALFESWLLAPGNSSMLLFWTWVWMVHHQSQLGVRKVITRTEPTPPAFPAAALPAR